MTQPFVTAFITTCFEAGLSKEAAAELLQKYSVDRELADRPSFAEGYQKQASMFPGGLRVMLPASMVKRAMLGSLLRGGKSLLGGAGKFIARHPRASTAAGAGAIGAGGLAGGYALNNYQNRDRALDGLSGDLTRDIFLPAGGIDKDQYEKLYADRLNQYATGIYAHNSEYDGLPTKISELERSMAEGRAGANSLDNLQSLKDRRSQLEKSRTSYLGALSTEAQRNRSRIEEYTAKIKGMKPGDSDYGTAQDALNQASLRARLAADRQKLLEGRQTGPAAPRRDGNQLTTDFFQSYAN